MSNSVYTNRIYIFFMAVVTLVMCRIQHVHAQSASGINWENYAVTADAAVTACANGDRVLLYNKSVGRFLTVGGPYGAHVICTDAGIGLIIKHVGGTGANALYSFQAAVENGADGLGSYLGYDDKSEDGCVYCDRAMSDKAKWKQKSGTGQGTAKGTEFKLSIGKGENWTLVYDNHSKDNTTYNAVFLKDTGGGDGSNNIWMLIPRSNIIAALFDFAQQNRQATIDVSSAGRNMRFFRNATANLWAWVDLNNIDNRVEPKAG